jgi:hypothetical protein
VALREAGNALLDSAVVISREILEACGFRLAGPVTARFHSDGSGSTGVEITARVADPAHAAAARQALVKRFGGESSSDRFAIS